MSIMNILSAMLVVLILGAGVALYFGMRSTSTAGYSAPVAEALTKA